MQKRFFFAAALTILLFVGAGCIQIGKAPQGGGDGGIYVSVDKGQSWVQKNIAPTAQGVGNINNIGVMDLIFDPQDNKALYLASVGSGLFYTWDAAKSWYYIEGTCAGYVNSAAVDYANKCVLYAALQNKVWKSADCARSWKTLYYDTRVDAYISALAVDPANSNVVYAGLSVGDLLKSIDGGISWSTISRFNNKVQRILIHPKSSNIILAALETDGLRKSVDGGKQWADLREKTKEFRDADEIYDLDTDKDAKILYLVSKYGVMKSEDFGDSWKKIDLLTPPGSARIYSFAVNPNNADEIYYATASTFYSSSNGGRDWKTKKLPTSRAGAALLVDPQNPSLIYLGTRQFKK